MSVYKSFMVSLLAMLGGINAVKAVVINDFAADYADTVLEVAVAKGETNTLSGVISGTSSIVKTGFGCLKLGNGANSFSGGVTVNEGVVEVTAAGALGTGKVSVAGSITGDCQLFINYPNAVIANDIAQTGASYSGSSNCQPHPMLKTGYSTTFTGTFTAVKRWEMTDTGAHVTNVINGTISMSGLTFGTQPHGVLRICGPYTFFETSFTYTGDPTLLGGVVEIATPASEAHVSDGFFASYVGVRVVGDDCFGPKFYPDWSVPQADDDAGFYDLNGHDMAVRMLDWFYARPFTATQEGCRIFSDKPCTLTLGTSVAPSKTLYRTFARLDGPINLVKTGDYTQIFSNRYHQMSGELHVSNGTLRVEGTCRFANVPRLVVAEAGTLAVNVTDRLPFGGVTDVQLDGTLQLEAGASTTFDDGVTLALGENARLFLPEGGRMVVASVTTGGVRVASADLPNLPQVSGGMLCYKESATWTGGGATPAMTDMDNWNTAFPLSALQFGTLTATFAASGDRAELNGPVAFNQIVLNTANDFTFSAVGDAAALACAGMSLIGAAPNYVFDVPLSISANQELAIPAGTSVRMNRGFTAAEKIQKSGAGTLHLAGAHTLNGGMTQSGGSVFVSGTVATEDAAADAVRQPAKDGTGVYTIYSNGQGGGQELVVSNAMVNLPVYLYPMAAEAESIWAPAGTTNLFFGRMLGENSKAQRFYASTRSCMTFANQVSVNWTLWLSTSSDNSVPGRFRFTNDSTGNHNRFDLIKLNGAIAEFDCSPCDRTDGVSFEMAGSEMIFHRSSIITNKYLLLQPYGNGTPKANCWASFNTTSQRVDYLKCTVGIATSGIRGEAGSVLEIGGSTSCDYRAMVNGAISLVQTGTGTLTLSGRAFETTGELVVKRGTVMFAKDATWRYGTRVAVEGSGKIVLGQGETFGSDVVLALAGGGKLEIPKDACQAVRELWVNGRLMRSGIYGGDDSPAPNKLAQLTGEGVVRVRHLGTSIILR